MSSNAKSQLGCRSHPRYQGVRRPVECLNCWSYWNALHPEHDPKDRTGTPVAGLGTSKIPVYGCATCRDSGMFLVKTLTPDSPEADQHGRIYRFEACPVASCPARTEHP